MIRILLLFAALSTTAALAQDATESASDPAADAPEEVAEELADVEDDLDELYPVEDEDAFIPSENVAFGQSIPFPTDI